MQTEPVITYHDFSSTHDPLRQPGLTSERDRGRRGILLTLLTLFVPGGAQIAAGSRAVGRVALAVTVGCWFTILLGVLLLLTMRGVLLSALTQPFVMWLVTVLLATLAIGWALLWLDTFRLIRFGSLPQGMKPIIGVVLVVCLAVTSGGLGYAAHLVNEGRHGLAGIFTQGPSIPAEEGRYNFLLMGADAGEGREGLRPDSIHVISVNQSTAESIIFSIPRDFQNAQFSEDSPLREVYPEGFNCGNECIINFLYTEVSNSYSHLYPEARDPGAEAMMDAVSGTLDLNVHGYVMVDMGGFSELIDAMGGVTVESGGWVPYRGQRPDGTGWGDAWWGPGEHTFDGDEALAYARSRTFSTDYNRIQRQQCIQQAMIGQFTPQTLLTRFTEIMQAGENLVETNLPQSQLGSLLNLAADAQQSTPQRLTLGAPDFGSAGELFSTYPDFNEIHSRVDQLIAREGGGDDDSQDQESQAQQPGDSGDDQSDAGTGEETSESDGTGEAPGPTPEHSDPAVAEDLPDQTQQDQADEQPTQPDGSALTVEYLMGAQDRGEEAILYAAAGSNGECSPVR